MTYHLSIVHDIQPYSESEKLMVIIEKYSRKYM